MYELHSLGGVQIRNSAGDTVRLRSKKHVGLILYLAATGRRSYARDLLARLFWTTPLERSRHSLSQALYDLRQNIPGAVSGIPGDSIRLETSMLRFDALEFEQAVKAGDLGKAVNLYRGPFADSLSGSASDDFERWLESERMRLARLAELVLRRYVRQCDESGQWGEMCVAALRLVKVSPLDEEAHRALMRGLWLHGDAASAIRHFDEVGTLLERELPEGVSSETSALLARIRSTPAPEPWEDNLGEILTPFLGREAELESLRATVRQIRKSPTTAVIVSGEAGIGKTRLMRELTRSVSLDQLRVLESRCYPAEADVPYGPIVDGLRPVAESLAERPDDELERFTRVGHLLSEFEHLVRDEGRIDPAAWRRRLYEEVAGLIRLAMEEQPVLWVIEDVQWMDATSTSLLHYLTRRLEGSPFILVATLRVPRGGELPETLPANHPDGSELTRELRLTPLTPDQIGEILHRAAPNRESTAALQLAQRLAGGNPFFALEVFRAAIGSTSWAAEASHWDPLTDKRLSKVLAIRLKGLTRQALGLLQSTAILERHATPGAVAAVAGVSLADAATISTDLYSRGLLQDEGDRLGFTNDIVREYVYAEMTALQRAALHLAAARHLRSRSSANAATLARHYHLGEDHELTYQYAVEAAKEAKVSGGQMEAAAMAELAVRNASGKRERLTALHLLAEAELESAQLTRAKEHFNEILREDDELTPEQRVEVRYGIVRATGGEGDWRGAEELIRLAGTDIRAVSSTSSRIEKRFEALNWRLKAANRSNDHLRAKTVRDRIRWLQHAARRRGVLTRVSDATARCSIAAYELFYGSANDGLAVLSEVPTDHSLPGSLVRRVRLLRGLGYQRMGDWDRSEYESEQALTLARKTNDTLHLATVLTNLSCNAIERGAWDKAELYLNQATQLHSTLFGAPDAAIPIRMNVANLAFYRGKARDARSAYLAIYDQTEDGEIVEFKMELRACLALTALQVRDRSDAERWYGGIPTDEKCLEGLQERFKVEWLWAYMNSRQDPKGVNARLERVAEQQRDVDRVSALKLRWLSVLLAKEGLPQAHRPIRAALRTELARAEMGWFVHFSERWLRLVDGG